MTNNMVLHIEDFGKIKTADIEITPLMMFIGDNNSGKSYMSSLLWGLFNDEINIPETDHRSPALEAGIAWLRDKYNSMSQIDAHEFKIDAKAAENLKALLNEILSLNKETICTNIFNKEMTIGKLSIDMEVPDLSFKFIKHHNDKLDIYISATYKNATSQIAELINFSNSSLSYVFKYTAIAMMRCHYNNPIYFPSSRTGFVLTKKMLVYRALNNVFSNEPSQKNILTKPIASFIESYTSLSFENDNEFNATLSEITRLLETNVVHGQVDLNLLPMPDIIYKPEHSDVELPMYLASSVVTEISPLILFLKYYHSQIRSIILEEPELCLHPKLQREMAKVMIRLVNAGVSCWATTHSDTIIQHVNNMIKINKHLEKEKLLHENGLSANDTLNQEDVRIYQFDTDANKTRIIKLDCGEHGFVTPTFNDFLFKFLRETRSFESEA